MSEQNGQARRSILEARQMVYEGIENFVKDMEQRIKDAGFTPFDIGFTATQGKRCLNKYECDWDIKVYYTGSEARKPLSWINSEKNADYPEIRTSYDALHYAGDLGPQVGFQVSALKYLYDKFIDEIWPELEDPTQEEFSQMTFLLNNCIEKLQEHADEIELIPKILLRNQERIALGIKSQGEAS